MVLASSAELARAARPGVLAGLVGALLLDAYRLGLGYAAHGELPEDHYRYVASGLIGSAAYALPGAAYLGVAIHLALAITWGIGFAWAALRSPDVVRRPITSGAFFGVLVYVVTRLMTFAAGIAHPETPRETFVDLVAHTIFFGIPIALIVSARIRTA